jgi:hypothetical protein
MRCTPSPPLFHRVPVETLVAQRRSVGCLLRAGARARALQTAVSLIGSLDDKPLRKRASEVLAKFSQPVHERGNAQSAGDGLRRRGNDADDVDAAEE